LARSSGNGHWPILSKIQASIRWRSSPRAAVGRLGELAEDHPGGRVGVHARALGPEVDIFAAHFAITVGEVCLAVLDLDVNESPP
jgi:hypothetical protein